MSDFAMISQAVPQVFTLYNILLIFGGLILAMVIGCVPGLSVTLGIILMLPLTYTFSDPASAIILLLAVLVAIIVGACVIYGAEHWGRHPHDGTPEAEDRDDGDAQKEKTDDEL